MKPLSEYTWIELVNEREKLIKEYIGVFDKPNQYWNKLKEIHDCIEALKEQNEIQDQNETETDGSIDN